ncbi:Crp/Fnr family transcriptional regulator [Sulfobacillus thermosulfidooxidans]|uniref:Crp/Fnr family transcriptional regulator n=1 Tax=Sulfobacillus thermosulfidooxidans TaxID=28034 RepID=UPI0006B3FF74|nr:Crp/Fnr family transcriptional regulator [Sulfobacillus thermosulfidooxidans]
MLPNQIPLLSSIPVPILEASSLTRKFTTGEVIFYQGEETTGLWIVLEGRISVERTSSDGYVFATGIWLPGDIIGIAGLWDKSPYPATAKAMETPTSILWISRDHVTNLQHQIPEFSIALCRTLATRLRLVQETIADTKGRPVAAQVAGILSLLTERMGPHIRITHEELARMLGVQRETITRTLHLLSSNHLISHGHGYITVLDATHLKNWTVLDGL